MPVLNNAIEKLIFGRMSLGPAPMLDMMGGFTFYAVTSAVELNLFEELNKQQMTTAELAQAVNCNERGLDTLLRLLETLGYLKLKKDRYGLTPMSQKWMLESAGINFGVGFVYYKNLMTDIWPFIAESMRKGDAHINFYDWLKEYPDTAASYQKFMMSLAAVVIPGLVKRIKLSNETVLDIGGSHGLYSIALCRNNPGIKVTIIDSEYAMPLLKKNITGAGMGQRIKLITGDFKQYVPDEKYDAILLFNVLHEHTEDYNRDLLAQIHECLKSSGMLFILDGMKEKHVSRLADLAERMYSLLFFHFLGGRNYSFDEISLWLKEAGFSRTKRNVLHASQFTIIKALC